MRLVIYALGALLAAMGLVGLYWSIDLVGVERGTTYASAGAALLGSGVVTVALGRVIALLERIAAGAARAPAAVETAPVIEAARAPTAESTPEPALGAAGLAAAAAQAEAALAEREAESKNEGEKDAGIEAMSASGDALRIETKPARPPLSPVAAPIKAMASAPAPAPRAEDGPGGLDPFPAQSLERPPGAKVETPPTRIVGRYQANGVDYALFSDGSIEAERNGEKRRFASLAELKIFIESA